MLLIEIKIQDSTDLYVTFVELARPAVKSTWTADSNLEMSSLAGCQLTCPPEPEADKWGLDQLVGMQAEGG